MKLAHLDIFLAVLEGSVGSDHPQRIFASHEASKPREARLAFQPHGGWPPALPALTS